MGRPKKNQELDQIDDIVAAEEVVDTEDVAAEIKEEEESQPVEDKVAEVEEANVVGPEIDTKVQNLLRIFNSYDELYITKTGGVFPKNNKPTFVKDAVLYRNPFFKKI